MHRKSDHPQAIIVLTYPLRKQTLHFLSGMEQENRELVALIFQKNEIAHEHK